MCFRDETPFGVGLDSNVVIESIFDTEPNNVKSIYPYDTNYRSTRFGILISINYI